ncbi:MAG: hypothetical protein FJ293_02120 [Planctomycetes bacterium]|nr:hypothetical protein [Planctomycetota bacterium]
MFPHERSLVNKLKDEPFALIGVNSDVDLAAMKPKFKDEQITWRSFWCGKDGTAGAIPTAWNVRGWPTLYLIDHNGTIRQKWLGSPAEAVLDAEIDKLVADAKSAGGKKKEKAGAE